jgi:hypothetical protein
MRAAAASTPWKDFAREVERSRRYEHPFALIVLPLPEAVSEVNAKFLEQGRDRAGLRIRTIDKVWLVGRSLYLLLPETATRGALGLLSRLERESHGFLSAGSARIVAFPEDGLTPLALIASLREGWPLSDLGDVLPPTGTNGGRADYDLPTGDSAGAPPAGVRVALHRALLSRARVFRYRDPGSAAD